jgi:CCR4-NOT transcription complex subunit 7/8
MNSDIHWYGFHTDHDFAYLLKMLSAQPIPSTETQFVQDLSLIFPNFYDLKTIADMSFGIYRGSLAALSEKLSVYRDDECAHQAGSDSKITAKCFFALQKIGDGSIEACKGDIYGLNQSVKTVLKS